MALTIRMKNVVVRMDNGDVLEFSGTLVASASREVHHDGLRSTVFEYRLYRTAENGFVLAMETYEKNRSRNFYLCFKSKQDAQDYLARDKDRSPLIQQLFDPNDTDPQG